MTDERRASPRAPGVLDGAWFGSGQRCRITSLSVSGCYIESLSPPGKGARIRVRIELQQQGSVSVDADVLYMEPRMGFAVMFVDLTSEIYEALARAVDLLIDAEAFASQEGQPAGLAL